MEKKKVLVSGCNGAMGRILGSLIEQTDDLKVACGFDLKEDFSGPFPIYDSSSIDSLKDLPDIIIDFSSPVATDKILKFAEYRNIPIVIATTDLPESTMRDIDVFSKHIPIFQSANMSFEVNMLKNVLKEIAMQIPDADVEITETHHTRKKDAPSGTAKAFANAIKDALNEANKKKESDYTTIYGRTGKRQKNEIGICAKRGANIVGTHTVEFFTPFETLEITHTAHSRDLFADGAINAARFLLSVNKSGLYNMDDLM